MSQLTIITNHVPRDIIEAWELTPEERAEFDYLDWDALEEGAVQASFVRYKGELYDLDEFAPAAVPGWDGWHSDTFFSGLLVRYASDFEQVIVARYYA